METFTRKIVALMKEHELFSWQGGPIILAQVRTAGRGWNNTAWAVLHDIPVRTQILSTVSNKIYCEGPRLKDPELTMCSRVYVP
jgi:hypothetical protein